MDATASARAPAGRAQAAGRQAQQAQEPGNNIMPCLTSDTLAKMSDILSGSPSRIASSATCQCCEGAMGVVRALRACPWEGLFSRPPHRTGETTEQAHSTGVIGGRPLHGASSATHKTDNEGECAATASKHPSLEQLCPADRQPTARDQQPQLGAAGAISGSRCPPGAWESGRCRPLPCRSAAAP